MSEQTLTKTAAPQGIVSPTRLAHVVLRTSQMPVLLQWYKTVLNAETAFANDEISFLSYDDEHHRIAFIHIPGLNREAPGTTGLHHVAFTHDRLEDLLGNYRRLRDAGIVPTWCVNHGPTTSMYYTDPDGNQIEFQVDNYATVEEAGKYFYTQDFATNTIGVDYDPEDLIRRLEAGESAATIKLRPDSGPRGVDTIPLR